MQIEKMIKKIKRYRWLLVALIVAFMVIGLLLVIFVKKDTAPSSVGLVSSPQLSVVGKPKKGVQKDKGDDKKRLIKKLSARIESQLT